jgi:DNA-binding MarR family transcriptional regulator
VDEYFQKANITRIVNKLRDKGFVAKESDLVDKRRLHILITHAGRKLING